MSKTEKLLKKYKVSHERFREYFIDFLNELDEFLMPNTSAKDIITRFDIQGFWSGNRVRVYIVKEDGNIGLEAKARTFGN